MTWLADHSLRVAALMIVVGAGSMLARRASAHSRLFAWTTVLYLAAAMPLLSAVLPDVRVPVEFTAPVIVVPGSNALAIESIPQAGPGLAGSPSPAALPWLLATYVAVAGLLFTRLFAGVRQTTRMLRRARPVDDATLVTEVQALSASMRLPHPRVVQHASVHVPFVCGLFRPALVLPNSWDSWDAATRRAVLTHELSHLVRRDLWTLRAAAAYRAVTWMNPMSWWLRRKLETLAERASDDEVLASGVEPTAYAQMLVQFFEAAQRTPGRASWQLAMARRGVEAGKRVGRVLNGREGDNVRLGMAGRVLVGVGVVLAAVPAIVLTARSSDVVTILPAAIVARGLENQTALPGSQAALRTQAAPLAPLVAAPSQRQVKRSSTSPVPVLDVTIIQEQEQEPEPWRSTRKATGADVLPPEATIREIPKYTPDAMRAKIQGMVAVEIIVSPEGNVTAARVIKSLDKDFGLDEEAVKVARLWKFVPGTYQGQAVAMRVVIDLEFRLH